MTELTQRLKQAARKRQQTKAADDRADQELRAVIIEARTSGMGPSEISRHTGLTREWVAKIVLGTKKGKSDE